MVRFFTLLTFLVVILIVAGVYFYNEMISTEFSIKQGLKSLKEYFMLRKAFASGLLETVPATQTKILKKIHKGYNDEYTDQIVQNDNLFTQFVAVLVEKKLTKEQKKILTSLGLLEKDTASVKRFINSKTTLYNSRLQTFPTSLIASFAKKEAHTPFDLIEETAQGISPDYSPKG